VEGCFENGNEASAYINYGEISYWPKACYLLRRNPLRGVSHIGIKMLLKWDVTNF